VENRFVLWFVLFRAGVVPKFSAVGGKNTAFGSFVVEDVADKKNGIGTNGFNSGAQGTACVAVEYLAIRDGGVPAVCLSDEPKLPFVILLRKCRLAAE